jgi:hypothetical protein
MTSPFDSLVQIRIIKDNIRALPAQFQRYPLQITFSRSLHDFPALGREKMSSPTSKVTPTERVRVHTNKGASRERNFVDSVML